MQSDLQSLSLFLPLNTCVQIKQKILIKCTFIFSWGIAQLTRQYGHFEVRAKLNWFGIVTQIKVLLCIDRIEYDVTVEISDLEIELGMLRAASVDDVRVWTRNMVCPTRWRLFIATRGYSIDLFRPFKFLFKFGYRVMYALVRRVWVRIPEVAFVRYALCRLHPVPDAYIIGILVGNCFYS